MPMVESFRVKITNQEIVDAFEKLEDTESVCDDDQSSAQSAGEYAWKLVESNFPNLFVDNRVYYDYATMPIWVSKLQYEVRHDVVSQPQTLGRKEEMKNA